MDNNKNRMKDRPKSNPELRKINPKVEQNIFKSVENVNLKTIIAYTDWDESKKSFLDFYKEQD